MQSEKQANSPRLSIGDKAPVLDIAHWLSDGRGKREHVSEFQAGKVYLIEFWGTWCGACIGNMPELVELQNRFADRGVVVIGVTDEELEKVNVFLKQVCHHDKDMTYGELTSAYCLTADPDGSVFKDYMRGIERRSFPSVAIVGKTGLIEYIGSANGLESTLESILNDTWDRGARKREAEANAKARKIMFEIADLVDDGKVDECMAILDDEIRRADQKIKTISYQMRGLKYQNKQTELMELLDSEFIAAVGESIRWNSNRWHFILEKRTDLALSTFEELVETYSYSAEIQIELTWPIYLATTTRDDVEEALLIAAKRVAKNVVSQRPDNANCLDIYAHILFALGEHDESIKTFKLAIEKSNETNRSEIEDDLKNILQQLGK